MTKIERAIKALEELPPERSEEIADIVLELAAAVTTSGSVLSEEQRAEVRRRRASGFEPADPSEIDRLLASLA
ncbi:MAG: hypothetical protein ABUS57_01700 [Pseudomonadota bacterium]